MSVSPQVGDVVRLTITTVTEGEVWKDPRGCLRVCSYYVYPNDPARTVGSNRIASDLLAILSRTVTTETTKDGGN